MKIGFVAGSFDLLHAGHILMLAEAKSKCDRLIVGLHTDPTIDRKEKNKPIQSTFERYLQLRALQVVDDIVPYDTEEDLLNILTNTQIDIRFLGDDYKALKAYNGSGLDIPIHFCHRKHNYSTSELRSRIEQAAAVRNIDAVIPANNGEPWNADYSRNSREWEGWDGPAMRQLRKEWQKAHDTKY